MMRHIRSKTNDSYRFDKVMSLIGEISSITDSPRTLLDVGAGLSPFKETALKNDWIYSIDTSNPVIHGLKSIYYKDQGLWDKESQKLFTMINSEVTSAQMEVIRHNVSRFRWFANGNAQVDSIL